jgi:hypothetical protein
MPKTTRTVQVQSSSVMRERIELVRDEQRRAELHQLYNSFISQLNMQLFRER